MREKYSEYRGRQNRRPQKAPKNKGYLRKFLRQTVFSVIIFSAVISPESMGLNFGKDIKSITKSALFYTINTDALTEVFKNLQPRKGESTNDKETETAKDI